jgi:branched-chain amino acid aminotransferase
MLDIAAMTTKLVHNGKLLNENAVHVDVNNRSFRYGDGCFETMKVKRGQLLLANLHWDRLFNTLQVLRFELPNYFTPQYLQQQVEQLVKANGHTALARIRLTVYRGNGGLYDAESHYPHCLIQSWALNPATQQLNENGLVAGIYTDALKSCDQLANLKTNNYLPYAMAALWAKEQKLNEVFLLNSHGHIADATIANVWVVKDGVLLTPALNQGPVNGVMRRYLLQCVQQEGLPYREAILTPDDLLNATEVFTTNVIQGIKWVRQIKDIAYGTQLGAYLHKQYISQL